MESMWIQVFILTFAECVAPAGKSVCQQQEFEMQFLTRNDCEYALAQLMAIKDELDNVIIDRRKSGCAPSAAEVDTYTTVDEITAVHGTSAGWRSPESTEARRAAVNSAHRDRLVEMKTCEESRGVAPCKIGEIIVEQTSGDSVEVWRKSD